MHLLLIDTSYQLLLILQLLSESGIEVLGLLQVLDHQGSDYQKYFHYFLTLFAFGALITPLQSPDIQRHPRVCLDCPSSVQ